MREITEMATLNNMTHFALLINHRINCAKQRLIETRTLKWRLC